MWTDDSAPPVQSHKHGHVMRSEDELTGWRRAESRWVVEPVDLGTFGVRAFLDRVDLVDTGLQLADDHAELA